MDEIVLNVDLKFVLATLEMSERGELLTALLDGVYAGENLALRNVYQYIMKLQEERLAKKKHMRELSAKGVKARLLKKSAQASLDFAVDRRLLRKEAKESEFKNKYNLNLFSDEQNSMFSTPRKRGNFVPPSVDEVQNYVTAKGLSVDAENFVNFYESHGWMVGSTPIKNWQATLKLWHARSQNTLKKGNALECDDEDYWHELKHRLKEGKNTAAETVQLSALARQNVPRGLDLTEEQLKNDNSLPFARFMHRVEKYDINRENDDDK
jgi:hypothetical protein